MAETTPSSSSELAPLQVIRTETVLSRLPIHNLSKTGSFEIQIHRRNDKGDIDLRWEVSYSSRYGPPRQLAYKLDTVVINRKIDELGRPVPNLIRLGSLRDIARELDLGGDTNTIRKALRQNAFTAIAARLTYRGIDGSERRIEADFTRYGVIFAGEKLPDGRMADCVYLILNDPYLEVLNNAPVRPLNYDYLKHLAPAPQRFYEIVSYKVFAALKNRHAEARLSYSDFCTFSAVQRYYDYDHFKKQMYKIHRPHLESGYLTKARYEQTLDGAGSRDWIMLYEPGPRALAEFAAFERKRAPLLYLAGVAQGGEVEAHEDEISTSLVEQQGNGGELDTEMIRRGVSEKQARRLLAAATPDQPIREQLAWGDKLIRESRGRIYNPPGFYVYLIRENVLPPAEFLAGVVAQSTPESTAVGEPDARAAYEEYKREEIEHFIAIHYPAQKYEEELDKQARLIRKQYRSAALWSADNLRQVAQGALRAAVANDIEFISFEDFLGSRS